MGDDDVPTLCMHKNFNLEEFVKLNLTASAYYCMTFRARNAESDECYLFRGAVYVLGGPHVLLCEIRDDKEISIPADHDEYYDKDSSVEVWKISTLNTWSEKIDAGDGSAVCSVNANRGSDVDTVGLTKAPSLS